MKSMWGRIGLAALVLVLALFVAGDDVGALRRT